MTDASRIGPTRGIAPIVRSIPIDDRVSDRERRERDPRKPLDRRPAEPPPEGPPRGPSHVDELV